MKKIVFILIGLLAAGIMCATEPTQHDIVLIVPSQMNISSDYYPLDMIAESMNIQVDSVAPKLNAMVTNGLSKNSTRFLIRQQTEASHSLENICQKIVLRKISTERNSADLSRLTDDEFHKLLGSDRTNYIVIISGYFIQRMEKPFQTIFHTISYTVYDSNRKKTMDGDESFNTFDLKNYVEMEAGNRKLSKKITQAILKKAISVRHERRLADVH